MKRIRILHTADLHLDTCFASLGVNARVGHQLREAQRRVFTKIIDRARDWPADMLFICGDLFDDVYASDDTVSFVMEALEHLAPIQVYVVPGDRDPYTDTSPYVRELWPENVTVFSPGAWQSVEHPACPVVIHGIGCDGRDDSGSWFTTLRVPEDNKVHVALAHGTERSTQPAYSKSFAPFDAAAIAQEGLAYLALGHFHDASEAGRDLPTAIHYPGTPQGRSFKEQGRRYFLEVNVEANDGGPVSVQVAPVSCAEILFEAYSCPVLPGKDARATIGRVLEGVHGNPLQQAAQLRVTGVLVPPVYEFIEGLRNAARNRFLHAELVDAFGMSHDLPIFSGHHTCLSKLNEAILGRIADAPDRGAAAFEAYTRDLAVKACRGQALPAHDKEDVLS